MVYKKSKPNNMYAVIITGKKVAKYFETLKEAKKYALDKSKKTIERVYVDQITNLGYYRK